AGITEGITGGFLTDCVHIYKFRAGSAALRFEICTGGATTRLLVDTLRIAGVILTEIFVCRGGRLFTRFAAGGEHTYKEHAKPQAREKCEIVRHRPHAQGAEHRRSNAD